MLEFAHRKVSFLPKEAISAERGPFCRHTERSFKTESLSAYISAESLGRKSFFRSFVWSLLFTQKCLLTHMRKLTQMLIDPEVIPYVQTDPDAYCPRSDFWPRCPILTWQSLCYVECILSSTCTLANVSFQRRNPCCCWSRSPKSWAAISSHWADNDLSPTTDSCCAISCSDCGNST